VGCFDQIVKKSYSLILLAILPILIIPVLAQEDTVNIPTWVKASAGWWAENNLTDKEYIEGLEFLIDSNIIQLGNSEYIGMSELEKEHEEKLEQQEKRHTAAMFSDSQQWGKLSDEYDQKLVDERKRYDDMVERKGKEYRQAIQELEDEISKFKENISDVNRYSIQSRTLQLVDYVEYEGEKYDNEEIKKILDRLEGSENSRKKMRETHQKDLDRNEKHVIELNKTAKDAIEEMKLMQRSHNKITDELYQKIDELKLQVNKIEDEYKQKSIDLKKKHDE